MRYYTILLNGKEKAAASPDGKKLFVLDEYKDMNALIAAGGIAEIPAEAAKVDRDAVKLLSPIPHPLQDVLCLGINYTAHAEEASRFSKENFGGERPYPIFFSMGVIIGQDAKNVQKDEVQNYIFGYTIVNDVSARNLQTRHKQWYFGKSLDGFTPMGPCIVSADELEFPPQKKIACRVNGQVRQDSSTANLITGISDIIVMLSEGMTLKAGTVIATGTPAGVGMGMTPPTFLKPGDVVECEIEGIGVLRNYVE